MRIHTKYEYDDCIITEYISFKELLLMVVFRKTNFSNIGKGKLKIIAINFNF